MVKYNNMSIQRYISTSFWDDEWVQLLDPSEKLLYLYLMTNPLTNIAGIYKIAIRRICFDTGFNNEMIEKILLRFQKDGKAFHYKEYMILPRWPKHQKWQDKDTIKAGIDKIIASLPREIIEYIKNVDYSYPIDTAQGEPSYLNTDSDTNSNINIIPDEAIKLAKLLYELHKDNYDCKYKVSDQRIKSWSEDIEKLHRIDEREWNEIETVIKWIKSPNQFWATNIMSGAKLREKYPQIIPKVKIIKYEIKNDPNKQPWVCKCGKNYEWYKLFCEICYTDKTGKCVDFNDDGIKKLHDMAEKMKGCKDATDI